MMKKTANEEDYKKKFSDLLDKIGMKKEEFYEYLIQEEETREDEEDKARERFKKQFYRMKQRTYNYYLQKIQKHDKYKKAIIPNRIEPEEEYLKKVCYLMSQVILEEKNIE